MCGVAFSGKWRAAEPRKSNWIVAAIAAVACGVLLRAWFALGSDHVDDPPDLVVAVVWWLAVAAVVGSIVWAEGRRRERMRLGFIGEGELAAL